ncbi:MAG: MCE family protein [Mycobacteriaceae bacterium]
MAANRPTNPVVSGVIALVVLALISAAVLFRESLPIIGGGTTYTADFSEAAGLKGGDEVRVAGVRSGSVKDLKLDGDHVVVSFQVKDTWVGDKTVAAIEIKTLLGQKYLSLDPQGTQKADPDTAIPRARTIAPYDVIEAFSGLTNTLDNINTTQLAQSFQTLDQAFQGTPANIRSALDGVTRLSQTISSRDQQLATLLDSTKQTSKILADRNAEFAALLRDGSVLLSALNDRRTAIAALLTNTQTLSQQLIGLVNDNRAQLGPVLKQLQGVVDTLTNNLGNIDSGLALLAPFYRLFSNALGNGRWFDAIVPNFFPDSVVDLSGGHASPPSLNSGTVPNPPAPKSPAPNPPAPNPPAPNPPAPNPAALTGGR